MSYWNTVAGPLLHLAEQLEAGAAPQAAPPTVTVELEMEATAWCQNWMQHPVGEQPDDVLRWLLLQRASAALAFVIQAANLRLPPIASSHEETILRLLTEGWSLWGAKWLTGEPPAPDAFAA